MDFQKLVNLGLSEKEAKIYISSLKIGKNTAHKLAKYSEINRATAYLVLNSLMKKGLVSSNTENNKQYFFASSPENLNLIFMEKEAEIQKKKDYLKEIMPEIKALQIEEKNAPVVKYYEGKTGTAAMAEDLYGGKVGGEMRLMYSFDLLMEQFTENERKIIQQKRQNSNIKVKSIINDDKKRLETDAQKINLDSEKYPITSEISIFNDKVRFSTLKGTIVGLIIENKEISNTLKLLFDIAYQSLVKNKKG